MKSRFLNFFFLFTFFGIGCVQSQKESALTFSDTITKRNPATVSQPASDLDLEQSVKTNPSTCSLGWQLKNKATVDDNYKKAKSVLANNSCLNCHSSTNNNYAILNYTSTEEMLDKKGIKNPINIINPLDLKNSLILTKLANYGGTMPALSESDLADLKDWIKSIDYECLTEKEVVKVTNSQIKTADITIDQATTTYTTSKTKRSTSSLKVLMPNKIQGEIKIAEQDPAVITSESIESLTNLTKEYNPGTYKRMTTFTGSIKNKILRLDEKNTFTAPDGLIFSLSRIHNINLKTGLDSQETSTITALPPSTVAEINKIETSISTTGKINIDGSVTIIQKTKTLSKADNSYTIKDRKYDIDYAKLVFVDTISDFGPKVTSIIENGIRTEITINSYLKNGKTYIEKKIMKYLDDGSLVDGQSIAQGVSGSSLTTSEIDGLKFTYSAIPLVTDKMTKPTRVCDIASLEKKIDAQSTNATGRWLASKNVQIRLGDRYYVLSILKKVFGPAVLTKASSINFSNAIFGGNFDIYDIVRDDFSFMKIANASPEGYPFTISNVQDMRAITVVSDPTPNIDLIGPLNPLRIATSVRVCEDIVKDNNSLLVAIKNATQNQSLSLNKIPYPFKQDFLSAYNLFYPTDPISENTISALTCVADSETSALDQWRNIFLTLCITPEWQIP